MKRNESTNDKIIRLYNEQWEPERIAEEVQLPVGSVNSILERRIEGYAEILAQKSLAANKARTAAKEEALRQQREAEEALEAKQARYSAEKSKPTQTVNPDDFFNSNLDGMLVGSYKQKITEPEKESVNILTAEENRNILTGGTVNEPVAEKAPVAEAAPVSPAAVPTPSVAPVSVEIDANPAATASQKMALFAQAQIAENDAKIEQINAAITEVLAVVNANNAQTAAVNGEIESVNAQINELTQQIIAINSQIEALKSKKAELETAAAVDTNAELNVKIAAYNEQITALKTENEQYRAFIK